MKLCEDPLPSFGHMTILSSDLRLVVVYEPQNLNRGRRTCDVSQPIKANALIPTVLMRHTPCAS